MSRWLRGTQVERNGPLIFMSTGDPSGDLYGSALIREIRDLMPESFFIGLGGPKMEREGLHLLADPKRIATVGFTEILRDIPFFYRLLCESEDIFRSLSPDLVIMIDYPGFNLRLAKRAKKRRIRTLFYISPQIWAWHKGRYKDLVRNSDEIAVILPFEVGLFKSLGKEVHYVGHPLRREIANREPIETFITRYRIALDRPILGLSPGSRKREIDYHLPLFIEVAEMVRQEIPDLQILVNRAPVMSEAEMRERYLGDSDEIRVIGESHHTSIDISRLLLTKSGTSTLEAALLHTPMLVCYRMSRLSFLIARSLVKVSHVSLVNILGDREIVPEYVQSDFTPKRLFPVAMELMDNTPYRKRMISDLKEVSNMLTGEDANAEVARLVQSMLGSGG